MQLFLKSTNRSTSKCCSKQKLYRCPFTEAPLWFFGYSTPGRFSSRGRFGSRLAGMTHWLDLWLDSASIFHGPQCSPQSADTPRLYAVVASVSSRFPRLFFPSALPSFFFLAARAPKLLEQEGVSGALPHLAAKQHKHLVVPLPPGAREHRCWRTRHRRVQKRQCKPRFEKTFPRI